MLVSGVTTGELRQWPKVKVWTGACVDGAGFLPCDLGPGPAAAETAIGPDVWCHRPPAPPRLPPPPSLWLWAWGCLTFRTLIS